MSLPVSSNRDFGSCGKNSHFRCGHSTAPLAVPLNKANLAAAGLMSSAGTTWETKLKQNRRYQPVKTPRKGVGLGELGNGTVACDTVCVSPKEIISPLFVLKDLVIWRKHGYHCGSMKSYCFQHNKTLLLQIYTAMNICFWEIIDFFKSKYYKMSAVNIGVTLIYHRWYISIFTVIFYFLN